MLSYLSKHALLLRLASFVAKQSPVFHYPFLPMHHLCTYPDPRTIFHRLFIATVVGILAAFAVAGFRHAMLLLEQLFLNNDSGSLVNATTNLSPWRQLLTLTLGGLAAGLLLMGWQRFAQ